MSFTNEQFVADVAALYAGPRASGAFGSGRLIAPGLILTAGHIVDHPSRAEPARSGWKVLLARERSADRKWGQPHEAAVVWRGQGNLDLALLRLSDDTPLRPTLQPVFAFIKWVGMIGEVHATGFPMAWATRQRTLEFNMSGILWEATAGNGYAWRMLASPDVPTAWKGMSGAAVCHVGADEKLYLFGVVEEVPAHFSRDILSIASLSSAFADEGFCNELQVSLSNLASIVPFDGGRTRYDLGVARLFQSKIEDFKSEYLVSETGLIPFGGRDAELRHLNAWLLEPNRPPRILVTAPAGRGKSALLVQWMKALEDSKVCGPAGWELVFVPISIRYGTNRPEVFYEGLAQRMAEVSGKSSGGETVSDRAKLCWGIRKALESIGDRRILIVIDGIDEALRGEFDDSFLPRPLPSNMRVLLSGRWLVGDFDSQGWLNRLSWNQNVKVETFEPEPLDVNGIRDVFVKLGAPAADVAREPALIHRLWYLTKGEPLLVRFYAVDLWQDADNGGAHITRADLDSLKPGFGSYFERWFDHQKELWRHENPPPDPIEVDKMLSVMAFAEGPLESEDLLDLMKYMHGTAGVMAVDRLLEPLRRFVIGNGKKGTGYVLSHPKIGEYLQQERFGASTRKLRYGYAAWGEAYLAEVKAGRRTPKNVSAYALQFLPKHLSDAGAAPEIYMMMVDDGWRRAWEELEGGSRGFANAVQAARSAQPRSATDPRLRAHWRCALTLASIRSLEHKLPAGLMVAAVRQGVLSLSQAVHIAKTRGENVHLLADLAILARDDYALCTELALATLTLIQAELGYNADILEKLLNEENGICPESRLVLLVEAFDALVASPIDEYWSLSLAVLAPHLSQEQLDKARAATKKLVDPESRANALAALAPRLAPELRSSVLSDAHFAANDIRDEITRATVLTSLAPSLAPKLRSAALKDALAIGRRIAEATSRARFLTQLEPHLAPKFRRTVRKEAIEAAKSIADEEGRLTALAELAPFLTQKQQDEIRSSAGHIGSGLARSSILAELATKLPPSTQGAVIDEAIAAAESEPIDESRATALARLPPNLSPNQISRVVAAAKVIGDGEIRWYTLSQLARHLKPDELREAVAAAKVIGDTATHAMALTAVAAYLAPELQPTVRERAFTIAMHIGEAASRVMALAVLAHDLPSGQDLAAVREALAAVKAIADEEQRATALAALVPELCAEQLPEAIAAASTINRARFKAIALAELAPYAKPSLRRTLLREALAAAKAPRDEGLVNQALVALVPQLSPTQLDDALTTATIIKNEGYRSIALATLVPCLSAKQLKRARAAAERIDDETSRAPVLAELAPHLLPKESAEILESLDAPVNRALVLAALAPVLTKEQVDEALSAVASTPDECHSAEVLATLARHLSIENLGVALEVTKNISVGHLRAEVLASLVPYLTRAQLSEALAIANSIEVREFSVQALIAVAWRPSDQQLAALLALVDLVASLARPAALTIAMGALQPTFQMEGTAGIHDLWRTVADIYQWYP